MTSLTEQTPHPIHTHLLTKQLFIERPQHKRKLGEGGCEKVRTLPQTLLDSHKH